MKRLTLEILDSAINSFINKKLNKRKDSDHLFEEINRAIDKEINSFDHSVQTMEKKFLPESNNSLEFLEGNTTTVDQTAEKQRLEQIFFDNSKAELMEKCPRTNQKNEKEDLLTPQIKSNPQKPITSHTIKHSSSLLTEIKGFFLFFSRINIFKKSSI